MKTPLLCLVLISLCLSLFAQNELPVLRTNTDVLSIKDGEILRSDYWTIDPSLAPDIYDADKLNREKTVTFYSDIDSLSFALAPRQQHDFLVITEAGDTCLTRIQSGIIFEKTGDAKLTQDTIPFTLNAANNILIKSTLNDRDTLTLMFHTAQGSVSLTEKAVTALTEKSFDKSVQANTWGGTNTSRYSQGNVLQIGTFKQENLTIFEDKHTGPDADGKFGPGFFGERVIELNYDENILVIHSFLPEMSTDFAKADLTFRRGLMFIKAEYETQENHCNNEVLLHSGYGGTVLLDDTFVAENRLGERLTVISESSLKDSHGNEIKTRKAVMPRLRIGDTEFTEVPVNFFPGNIGRQKMSVLGADMLKRFHLFLDLQNAEIYLKPSGLKESAFGKI